MARPGREDSPKEFSVRVGNGLLRVAALLIMGGAHYLLEKSLIYIIPENMPWAKAWLQDISFVFFALIYVYLLWDMLKVFIPQLQPKPYPGTEEN
jgi:hypothetical protein